MSFSLSGTLSKRFIRYNVQFSFFFLNRKKSIEEKIDFSLNRF